MLLKWPQWEAKEVLRSMKAIKEDEILGLIVSMLSVAHAIIVYPLA